MYGESAKACLKYSCFKHWAFLIISNVLFHLLLRYVLFIHGLFKIVKYDLLKILYIYFIDLKSLLSVNYDKNFRFIIDSGAKLTKAFSNLWTTIIIVFILNIIYIYVLQTCWCTVFKYLIMQPFPSTLGPTISF